MKILAVASEIYSVSLRNQSITGLAVMVRDIYDNVSKEYDCYLLSSNYYLKEEEISNTLHILDSRKRLWKFQIRITDFLKALLIFGLDYNKIKCHVKNKAIIRNLTRTFLSYIKKIGPDIVNFHEFDNYNTALIKICRDRNIKCVVTNHLYIGQAQGCEAYKYLKNNEKILLNLPNLQISVISSGMKKRMMSDYPKLNPDNLHITIDGTSFVQRVSEKSERLQTNGKKVFLSIGNVMRRKNQFQLIRSLSMLDKSIRNMIEVWFLGTDNNGDIIRWINDFKCNDIAFYKGKVRSEQMPTYYKKAFATITTSFCEGFGLTMIEGYSYGVPAILPSDIDSFADIYDKKCAVAIKGRADKDILEAISFCVNRHWDTNAIQKRALDFNMDKVSKQYIDMYNKIVMK